MRGVPRRPPSDEVMAMLPPPCFYITGSTAFSASNTSRTFTAITRS